jgi:hypothetical protein
MKKLVLCLALFVASLAHASEALEQDLITRVRAIEESKDMALFEAVFQGGDMPMKDWVFQAKQFELMIARGIEEITFVEIYPAMLPDIQNGFTENGVDFIPNVKPYKMLEVRFKPGIKNGSAGFSVLVGERDGKLWISGLKKK